MAPYVANAQHFSPLLVSAEDANCIWIHNTRLVIETNETIPYSGTT